MAWTVRYGMWTLYYPRDIDTLREVPCTWNHDAYPVRCISDSGKR